MKLKKEMLTHDIDGSQVMVSTDNTVFFGIFTSLFLWADAPLCSRPATHAVAAGVQPAAFTFPIAVSLVLSIERLPKADEGRAILRIAARSPRLPQGEARGELLRERTSPSLPVHTVCGNVIQP